MLIDTSVRRQTYVEDCEVCCQPIDVSYTVEGGFVIDFRAERAQ
jgi:hypothetical protein